MQSSKILVCLSLASAIMFTQYTFAASFCTTTPEGKIRVDDCNYGSYEDCKRSMVKPGDCVANEEDKPSAGKVAPYCLVTWSTECKYMDYESCSRAATEKKGFCYLNPDYPKHDR